MLELELACDGGKDSLSMASNAGGEVVKAPGNLVVSAYVGCPDITATVRRHSHDSPACIHNPGAPPHNALICKPLVPTRTGG